jgi:hypothetical protein
MLPFPLNILEGRKKKEEGKRKKRTCAQTLLVGRSTPHLNSLNHFLALVLKKEERRKKRGKQKVDDRLGDAAKSLKPLPSK